MVLQQAVSYARAAERISTYLPSSGCTSILYIFVVVWTYAHNSIVACWFIDLHGAVQSFASARLFMLEGKNNVKGEAIPATAKETSGRELSLSQVVGIVNNGRPQSWLVSVSTRPTQTHLTRPTKGIALSQIEVSKALDLGRRSQERYPDLSWPLP